MSTLFLPIGPPGCGKSTFAHRAVDSDLIGPEAIVSTDETRRLLTGAVGNMSEDDVVFWIVQNVVKSRLKHGLDVWLDATNINNKYRDEALQGLPADTQIIVVLFDDVTEEECLEHNLKRPVDNGRVPNDVMGRMFVNFQKVRRDDLPGEVYSSKEFAAKFLRDDFKEGDVVVVHFGSGDSEQVQTATVDMVKHNEIFAVDTNGHWSTFLRWDQYNNKDCPVWFERETA